MRPPRALLVLARGLSRRCPRCGERDVFRNWFAMRERCPRCGLPSERGEGFWLGAMAINLGVTELLFGAVFVGWTIAAWPDPPWGWILAASLAINAVVPVLFYPFSKTIYLGIDLLLNRMDEAVRSSSSRPGASGSRPPRPRT